LLPGNTLRCNEAICQIMRAREMSLLKILAIPNPLLRKRSKSLREVTAEARALIDKLTVTLREDPLGIGLAAPQVGILEKIIVIDRSLGHAEDDILALVNPRLIAHHGSEVRQEGCLSVPGFYGPVERYSWVRVRALNRDGKPFELAGDGMLARVLQHEIDHLNGVLFIDRLSDWEQCEWNEECPYRLDRVKEFAHGATKSK
jgi:peptide deformylase